MPRTIHSLLQRRNCFAFALIIIAMANCLILPNQYFSWLQPSALATTVSPGETLNLMLTPLTKGTPHGTYTNSILNITDNDVPPAITSAPPPSLVNLYQITPYSHTFTATGSPSPTFAVTSGTLPSGLVLSSSGQISGFINRGGLHNITVTASNGVGTPATQTFTIRVNNPPFGTGETYGTAVNTTLDVIAPGVLNNDTDANGEPLTAVLEGKPEFGSVLLNSDGSFTYTPSPNFSGTDTFNYRVSDGYSTSTPPTQVHINVLSGGTLHFPLGAGFSGREDAGSIEVQILRTGGSFGTTTVAYSTSAGTAQPGVDYTPVSGTVTFANRQLVAAFHVPIINDSLKESDETVNLTIADVTGSGTLGEQRTTVLTIINDDIPTLQLSQRNYTVGEEAGNFNLTVTNSGDSSIPVAVGFSTFNSAGSSPCNTVNGLASSLCDYAPRVGILQFDVGETSKTISIPLVDDGLVEGSERFSIRLHSPTGGATLGSISSATITITDNDSTGTPPPLGLVLDESTEPNQVAAIDALLFLRGPFPVINGANLLNQGIDRNTRVSVLVTNLQLTSSETSSSVTINLTDGNNESYEVAAEVVQPMPYFNFTQVVFRLPDNLTNGLYTIKVKAPGRESNPGTIRIRS